MYKAIIVDDEDIVRKGLCNIIDWEKYGFSVCGEAANGKDAISIIEKIKPDFVLLDITMPEMTGIDVLEAIHTNTNIEKKPLFLILSGYPNFEYAQKAIEFGAVGYILKPVDEDILIEKLQEIDKKLSSLNKTKELQASVSDLDFQKKFRQMLLFGSVDDAFDSPYNDENTYQFLLISSSAAGYTGKILRLQTEVTDIFTYTNSMIFIQDPILIVAFINTPTQSVERYSMRFCKRFGEKVSGAIATIGTMEKGLEGALKSYTTARNLLSKIFFSTKKYLLKPEDITSNDNKLIKPNPLLPHTKEMLFYIETYDKINIENFFDKHTDDLNSGSISEKTVKKMCMAFIVEIQNKLHDKYPEKDLFIVSAMELVNEIYEQSYFTDVYAIIKNFIYTLTESFREISSNSTIMKVVQYVKTNYKSDLKLDTLGDQFNCNSAYLGKKFKEYTGHSFNTYMDMIRIEQAKKLLNTTDLKIYQISELVGYANPDYFYLKFRKLTNKTPKKYRELHK